MTVLVNRLRRSTADELAWHPEWPVAVVVGLAWGIVIVWHDATTALSVPGHVHLSATTGAELSAPNLSGSVGMWAVMSTAMMAPVMLPAARFVAINSLRVRRWRAVLTFAGTYVAGWTAVGILALVLVALAHSAGATHHTILLVVLATGTAWQLTGWKRRAVLRCPPARSIPPLGWRSDAACMRLGISHVGRCAVSCAPYMSIMAVATMDVRYMAVLTAAVAVESRAANRRQFIRLFAAAMGVALLIVFVAGSG